MWCTLYVPETESRSISFGAFIHMCGVCKRLLIFFCETTTRILHIAPEKKSHELVKEMTKICLSSAEAEFESIQQAVDKATEGDTLYLSSGQYDLVVAEPLQIRQQIRICPSPDSTDKV